LGCWGGGVVECWSVGVLYRRRLSDLSRREVMRVAWHEVPGETPKRRPSRGDGMKRFRASLSSVVIRLSPFSRTNARIKPPHQHPPTRYPGCNSDFAQYSPTPILHHSITPSLHHSAWQDSTTACPTKPKLCIDRPRWPRDRGALHNQGAGEVGRTSTKRRVRHEVSYP